MFHGGDGIDAVGVVTIYGLSELLQQCRSILEYVRLTVSIYKLSVLLPYRDCRHSYSRLADLLGPVHWYNRYAVGVVTIYELSALLPYLDCRYCYSRLTDLLGENTSCLLVYYLGTLSALLLHLMSELLQQLSVILLHLECRSFYHIKVSVLLQQRLSVLLL